MKIAAVIAAVVLGSLGLNVVQTSELWAKRAQTLIFPSLSTNQPGASIQPLDPGVICLPGQVQPRTKVAISSTASLRVMELAFKEGDRVVSRGDQNSPPAPGSILARLEDGTLKAALQAAEAKRDAQAAELEVGRVRLTAIEAQIASSRVCLGEAERNWDRYRRANADSVSETESDGARCKYDRIKAEHDSTLRSYEASKAGLQVLEKNLKVALAEVEKARIDLSSATLASPIDGTVTRVNVKVGEIVNGTITNPGTVLMEVADMDHMVLLARVNEDAISQLQVGQEALVHVKGYGDQPFKGKVESLAPSCTEEKDGTQYFKAIISLDTQGRPIRAGLSAEARVASTPSRGSITQG